MSYTEINNEKGMPFGGMPADEMVYKLEATDPALIAEVRGDDQFYDVEDNYDLYARAEIVDRTPDNTFLESDHPRRDPALPRTILNLRYAGGRGPNDYRLPQHPELFIGFTGNDPRGTDNQPRFDKFRAHTAARAREREVRMGHNVGHGDFIEADRPWGGMAFEYDKKEAQRRLKDYWKWFSTSKVGRPWGRNTVADSYYGVNQKVKVIGDGDEGLYVPEQDQPRPPGPLFAGQDTSYDPVAGSEGGGVKRVDIPANADTAPWRNIVGDADLSVQKYGGGARRGRETMGTDGYGGALAPQTEGDQKFAQQSRSQAVNRRTLSQSMSAAAAHRRAITRQAEQDGEYGKSSEIKTLGLSAPQLAMNIAQVAKQGVHDQRLRAAGTIQDHEGGQLGPGAGLQPPSDRQAALQSVQTSHISPSNARLGNAEAMVRSLREGSAAQFRMVQGQAVAAGKMGTATGEYESDITGGGLAPGDDIGAAMAAVETPLMRAAAAADLTVHNYGMMVPGDPFDRVGAAQQGGFEVPGRTMAGRREGRSKAPEFTGHTTETSREDRDWGFDAETFTGGLSLGEKNLRASVLSDQGDVSYEALGLGGLGDAVEVNA